MAAKRRKSRSGRGTPRTGDRARWVPAWITALAGAILLYGFTHGLGLGISPDSVSYLSAAESLSRAKGLLNSDGGTFSAWPPLLPILLSLPQRMGISAVDAARLVQTLLHAACLAGVVIWGIRTGLSRTRSFTLGAALVVSAPLLQAAAMLWSELFFSALCLLALERLVAFRSTGAGRAFWIAVAASALAAITRYAGLALIVGGALYLMSPSSTASSSHTSSSWDASSRGWNARLRRTILYALIASLPLALWMARNLSLGEGPTGPRHPAMLNWRQVVDFMGQPLPQLYLSDSWSTGIPGAIWMLAFTIAWILLFALAWRTRRPDDGMRESASQDDAARTGAPRELIPRADSAFALLLFIGCFVLLLAVAVARAGMDRPNLRLLAPVVMPTLLVLALLGDAPRGHRSSQPIRSFGLAILVLLALAGALRTPAAWRDFRERGAGLALPRWQDSGLAAELRARAHPIPLMSNRPDAVFYLCGYRAELSPREKSYQSHNLEIQTEELRRFERRVKSAPPNRGLYLAWFDDSYPFLLELGTLRSIYQVMVPVAELDDGILLLVPPFEGSAVD